MKFEKKGESKHTCYKDLNPGTPFRTRGDKGLFLKTEDEDVAVHLQTGRLSSFSGNDEVIVVKGKFTWEDK